MLNLFTCSHAAGPEQRHYGHKKGLILIQGRDADTDYMFIPGLKRNRNTKQARMDEGSRSSETL